MRLLLTLLLCILLLAAAAEAAAGSHCFPSPNPDAAPLLLSVTTMPPRNRRQVDRAPSRRRASTFSGRANARVRVATVTAKGRTCVGTGGVITGDVIGSVGLEDGR